MAGINILVYDIFIPEWRRIRKQRFGKEMQGYISPAFAQTD
jgi:hypothetical protein